MSYRLHAHGRALAMAAAPVLSVLTFAGDALAQTWDGESSGSNNWSGAQNWNPNGAPENDGTANIIMAGTNRLSPNVDSAWDIQSLSFGPTAGAFTLSGGRLTIRGGGITNNDDDVQTVNNPIRVNTTHTWSAAAGPMVFDGLVETPFHDMLTIAGGFNTTFDGPVGDGAGSLTLNKTGAGTLTFNDATTYSGVTTVGAGVVAYNTTYTTGNGLDIADGAAARVGTSGGPVIKRVLKTKSLDTHATGKLEMNANDLLIDYTGTSVEGAIRQLVKNGRASGTGITSTPGTPDDDKVLAVADNVNLNRTAWLGVNIDTSTVIGKYTFFGDANLDGQVTGDDYVSVDANLGTGDSWLEGDFNMSGQTTGDDYVAIDANLGKGTGNPLAYAELKKEMVALHAAMFGEEYLVQLAQAEAQGF